MEWRCRTDVPSRGLGADVESKDKHGGEGELSTVDALEDALERTSVPGSRPAAARVGLVMGLARLLRWMLRSVTHRGIASGRSMPLGAGNGAGNIKEEANETKH
jgi:hypothetical protein